MNVLLDTHALLWWLDDNSSMSGKARKAIFNPDNIVFVSAVSIWEIRIKEALGKITIPKNFQAVLEEQPFEMLAITVDHAHALCMLPMIHRDPFDRILIAQARIEKLTIITRDGIFKKYRIPLIKA